IAAGAAAVPCSRRPFPDGREGVLRWGSGRAVPAAPAPGGGARGRGRAAGGGGGGGAEDAARSWPASLPGQRRRGGARGACRAPAGRNATGSGADPHPARSTGWSGRRERGAGGACPTWTSRSRRRDPAPPGGPTNTAGGPPRRGGGPRGDPLRRLGRAVRGRSGPRNGCDPANVRSDRGTRGTEGRGPVTEQYVAAIDQGTTSSRCIVFDRHGNVVSVGQREHRQIFPRPGWVEHDAAEIWANVVAVVEEALAAGGLTPDRLAAVGITNQRETTVVWDRRTGEPVHHAIVWQDTRTDRLLDVLGGQEGQDRFRERCGLPLATYFSGPKLRWLLDEVPGLRDRAERGEVLFGTVDAWLVWKLTGRHVTDVTNASRTLLMNLRTPDWDAQILDAMGIPAAVLPEIRSSSEVYGTARGPLEGVPVAAALGDQHAALFGQTCFAPGDVKGTYGTGAFLVLNTGTEPVVSANGLLTTVGYRIGDQPAVYALEGSIAMAGSLVQWLRDNLGMISHAAEIEELAAGVADNGGCYIVPAFSGLFAPHWRSDARGVIAGLTSYVTRAHLARAVLEATAWQT